MNNPDLDLVYRVLHTEYLIGLPVEIRDGVDGIHLEVAG